MLKDFDNKNKERVKVIYHDLKAEINPMISDEIGKVNYIYHLTAGSMLTEALIIHSNLSMTMLLALAIY